MPPETPNVSLRLPNRPENVLVVRQALTGLAGALALDPIETNDLNTAVTEACNNVIMHAYTGAEGALEVEVLVLAKAIAVIVRDHGIGIHTPEGNVRGSREALPSDGMGLAVIDALARHVEFTEPAGGGTEVRMEFPRPENASMAAIVEHGNGGRALGPVRDRDPVGMGRASTVEVTLAPSALAQAILPRVLSALAVRAHFSTDRISDVQIVADLVAGNVKESVDGSHLAVGVTVGSRKLELRIGPVRAGLGERLVAATAADGLAPVIDRLTDAKRVAPAPSGETLELDLVDQR
jgi:serine/threonine-protein kinase RsbW